MYNFAFPLFRRSPREPVWTVQTQIGIFQINQLFFYNSQMQRSVYPRATTKTAEWPDTTLYSPLLSRQSLNETVLP